MMATLALAEDCVFQLPNSWVDPSRFEGVLLRGGDALGTEVRRVIFRFPQKCALMIDVVLRLLSFCNQLVAKMKHLRLEFMHRDQAIVGYLSRVGFFDCLPREVEVLPFRPTVSGAALFHGANSGLVEIERFDWKVAADADLRERLSRAVERGCRGRSDSRSVADSVATIFSELINNVEDHSETRLDAFAALQTYPRGDRMTIAVSDSGLGVLNTLRPALETREPRLSRKSDSDLLVEMFRRGISRFDDSDHGCGLKVSARNAVRFGADLDVRLDRTRVLLKPANGAYRPNMAYTQDHLSLLQGTHLAFSLKLS
jgi:hypothetical protein